MDLQTILRAIELVGPATKAATDLYEGFIAITQGETQDELKTRYAAARDASDAAHTDVQTTR